ncbi:MAG TPA: DNA-3-methyladenine glycosylase [Terriglobales bacterium]|nr:DNA-3-methyladenine glycosylase [Terriglobales bacterium]
MAAIIEQVGPLRMDRRPATYEAMARAIVFQQLAGAAAKTIFQRLQAACEKAVGGENTPRSLYGGFAVTPESVLSLSEEQMRACGLSRQKISYIRDLAEKALSREVDFERMPNMSDDDVIEHLTRVKGVGTWSAQMFLMFALGRPDVMPTADLGLNNAIRKLYRKRKTPKPKDILKLAEKWRPYRTAACWYLWRSVDVPAVIPDKIAGSKNVRPNGRSRTTKATGS